ncbi:MAG TPA: hypothetical protein VFD37_03970 [Solirubrobacterales bacterium]|nr:hypothetical protein [Solirubrobacterales bacterium]
MRIALIAIASIACFGIFAPGQASADFGIEEFEAGTCSENTEPAFPFGTGPGQCTYDTPGRFYTQAGGHPNFGIIDFTFNTQGSGAPDGQVQNVRTDLPVGLSVNPEAVPKCTEEQLETVGCPPDTKIGENYITAYAPGVLSFTDYVTLPAVNVYNMVPPEGQPLMAGMRVVVGLLGVDEPIYLVGDVEWEGDYHQFFTISDISEDVQVVRNRLVFDGQANADGAGPDFIRMPSTCVGPQRTYLHVASHADPDDFVTTFADTPLGATGCDAQPFDPQISVDPASDETDSPSAVTIEVEVPESSGDIQPSDIREARVTLPEGMVLNPAAASNLGTCTNAQFGIGTRDEIKCPASSEIGTTAVETPVLPPGTLQGKVYAGEPLSNNPASGEQFRIFADASNERFGVSVRLAGKVMVHPETGRLTAIFDEIPDLKGLPQAPASSVAMELEGGPHGILSTPTTCGPHVTTAKFVPWSTAELSGGPISAFEPSDREGETTSTSSFTLADSPGGGDCAESKGDRPFSPGFDGVTSHWGASVFTKLSVDMSRDDGEQELKDIDLTLPAGLTAKLAGVPYCSEEAIAAARDRDGRAEMASRSCPDASNIGIVGLRAGTGPDPYQVRGYAYLAGPYAGAPLSMVVITPAVAGPYDLGTVVVRVALHVNPVTLEIRALSDPIPSQIKGVNLGVRFIDVWINRENFNVNPTGCWEKFFHGSIFGGGSNPGNSAAWSSRMFMTPYTVQHCEKLGFGPQVFTRMFGPPKIMRRSGHPALRAVVKPRGKANIRRAAVTLPPSLQLDQANIRTVCTRDQYAEGNCPKRSIYGWAVAKSPLLDKRLRGPVYLRSSDNPLPDLVASLRGQVNVELAGRIESKKGRIKTVYTFVPDVPVDGFLLRLRGGPRGLLVANKDLCTRRWAVANRFKGQNGKKHATKSRLAIPCRQQRSR